MKYFDRILSILSFLSSISIYLFTKDKKEIQDWLIPFYPIILLLLYFLVKYFNSRLKVHRYLLNEYKLITSSKIKSNYVLEVINTDGDIKVDKQHEIILTKKGISINRTKGEVLLLEEELEHFPVKCTLLKSSNSATKLIEKIKKYEQEEISGILHHRYEWYYNIKPPLVGKNSFVKFKYDVTVKNAAKRSFTEEGDFLIITHSNIEQKIDYTFICPNGFKIVIIEYYFEDFNNNKLEITENKYRPKLESNDRILRWLTIKQYNDSKYVCKYKLVKN